MTVIQIHALDTRLIRCDLKYIIPYKNTLKKHVLYQIEYVSFFPKPKPNKLILSQSARSKNKILNEILILTITLSANKINF